MADELIRGLALSGGARVVAAETTAAVEELRSVHGASPTSTAALGRVATGALLLASSLEKVTHREPVLTIEIDGSGPIGRVLATASPAGWVRALAHNPAADRPSRPDGKLDVGGVVGGAGTLGVARDLGCGQPYRGVVPLVSGEIGVDLASYLRDSEQARTAVALGVFVGKDRRVAHAGGLVVQLMPGAGAQEAERLEQRFRFFGEVTSRLRAGEGPEAWLDFLFPDGIETVDRRPVEFRCGCSLDRVERALKLLGESELTGILGESRNRPVEVKCEFCRKRYELPRDEVARLLLEARSERSSRSSGPAQA
jgi:molecular chaperone Hsp33